MGGKGLPSAAQTAEGWAADPRRLQDIKSKHPYLCLFTVRFVSPIDPSCILAEPASVSRQGWWAWHRGTQLAPEGVSKMLCQLWLLACRAGPRQVLTQPPGRHYQVLLRDLGPASPNSMGPAWLRRACEPPASHSTGGQRQPEGSAEPSLCLARLRLHRH